MTFLDLRGSIEGALDLGGWIIFMFHGVGEGTHELFIEADEHAKLLDYVAENSGRILASSMIKVASYLKAAGYAIEPNKDNAGDVRTSRP